MADYLLGKLREDIEKVRQLHHRFFLFQLKEEIRRRKYLKQLNK